MVDVSVLEKERLEGAAVGVVAGEEDRAGVDRAEGLVAKEDAEEVGGDLQSLWLVQQLRPFFTSYVKVVYDYFRGSQSQQVLDPFDHSGITCLML